MPACTFPNVIADINALLLSVKLQVPLDSVAMYKSPPLPIVAPAPQRPKEDYATILNWKEDVEELYHYNTSDASAVDDGAPPWPPVLNFATHQPRAPQPSSSVGANGAGCSFEDDEWSDTSSELYEAELEHRVDDPPDEYDEYESNEEDSDEESTNSKGSGGGRCATGFFIGRDGTAWPMPPPECMPGSSPSPYQQTTARDRSHPSHKMPKPPSSAQVVPRPSRVAAAPGSPLSPLTSPSPPGSSTSPTSEAASPPSSSPYPATPPDAPTSGCPSLIDLGRQWYASFGKALGARFGGRSSPMRLSERSPLAIESRGPLQSPPPSSPSMGRMDSETHVVGRHGLVWPRPPPPPTEQYAWG
ncbi:hypothetical protein C8Q78DRAFT_989347 [Trametes maxima]|nr:hypothetical protein C8Q78DRAFT_989347 [Trametes maxima]